MKQQPYCLVLGGGGAKGVYHIGVWQALKELNIPINAFIGNSIGAVIAAFLAQGAEEELLAIARSIKLKTLIRLNKENELVDENSILKYPLSYWQEAYKTIVEKKGIDTTPMRSLLESNLSEEKIRNSGFDFGITTVNVSDFKPREVFIEQMEQNHLINYVMASAAFPGFSNPEIKGKKYIDGGLFDNIPFNMARRRGYRKIILVDISGIGFNRRPKTEGTETVYIKNSIDMGNAFDFSPEFTQEFWQLGYLDCLQTFGKLTGYQYFFVDSEVSESNRQKQFDLTPIKELSKLFPEHMKHDQRWWLKTLEVCAEFLHIKRIKKYTYAEMEKAIEDQIEAIRQDVSETVERYNLEKNAKSTAILEAFIKDIVNNKKGVKQPLMVILLIKQFEKTRTLSLIESTVNSLNPEIKIVEAYLKVINKAQQA